MFFFEFFVATSTSKKSKLKTQNSKQKQTHPPRRRLQVQRRVQRPDDAAVPVRQRVLDVVERRVEQRAPSGVPGRGLDSDGLVDGDGAAELGVYFFFLAFFWKGAISSANER